MSEFGQGSVLPCNFSTLTNRLAISVTNNRILLQKMVESKRDPELFRFATSDRALMHGALLLSANSRANLCRSEKTHLEPILYQHKTETIRLVNERLGNRRAATSDGTVGAIACLVILEVCPYWSRLEHHKTEKHLQPGTEWSCSNC